MSPTTSPSSPSALESEQHFRAIFDYANDAIFIHDLSSGAILDVNLTMCEMYGYTREQALCLSIGDLSADLPPYTQQDALKWLSLAAAGTPQRFEWLARGRNQRNFWTEVRMRRAVIGNQDRVIVTVRDIHNQKTAELELRSAHEALKETGERLRLLLESSSEGIFGVDTNGKCIFVNQAAANLWGYSHPSELIGQDLHRLTHHTRLDGRPYPDHECWMQTAFRGHKRIHVDDEIYWRKNGTYFNVEYWAAPMFRNGEVIGAVSAFTDITARKANERALEQSSREWSAAMDASQDVVYLLSLDRRITRANRAFYNMIGSTPEATLGQHIASIVHPQGETVPCQVCQAQEDKQDLLLTMEANHPDNPAGHPIEISLRIIRDPAGTPLSMMMTLHDLTHERKVQDETIRLKDLFTDILRHDILSPVTAIQTSAELLLRLGNDTKTNKILNGIKNSTRILTEMAENAAKYAKLAAVEDFESEAIDCAKMLRDLMASFAPLLREKDISIHFPFQGSALAEANPLLKDVFANLISNAIKYSPAGSLVEINLVPQETSWVFSVKDSGEGILDEYKERIFNRFERAGKQGVKGSGLGLAIAQQIISLHKGKIWVEDNPKGGSIFWVQIPKKRT